MIKDIEPGNGSWGVWLLWLDPRSVRGGVRGGVRDEVPGRGLVVSGRPRSLCSYGKCLTNDAKTHYKCWS